MTKEFYHGLRDGFPIGLGYLSVSFTFGIIAVKYGFSWWQALIISMLTVTSAGQFAGLTVMQNPGHYFEMLISQCTINVRYSFMSISLSQKVNPRFRGIWRVLFGFMITDEIFAVACSRKEVSRSFFAGLCVLPYLGWSLGTLAGGLLGNVLPHPIMSALGLAIYGMFVAIVVPDLKRGKSISFVVVTALVLSCIFNYVPVLKDISAGISISICAIVAALLGALIYPQKDEEEEA
ncbi:MAG: AzlC family ABC transporter permease [Lachnospiraceae bacterium]|nr:AzlC family ABC transporter permease [Lachnospiraceae bacterium]